jgi:archaellum component FlaC
MAPVAADPDDTVSPENGQVEESAGGEPAERTDTKTDDLNPHMTDETEELRARLSEKDDRIAELESEVEQLEAEREQVASAYAEALAAGDSVFTEDELAENFTVGELREKYSETETATMADTEPTVQSGGGGGDTRTASLSDAEQEEVAKHREAIEAVAGSDSAIARNERRHRAGLIGEITGEDAETVLANMEVNQ